MLDFTYCAPTRVYFGKGRHREAGRIIREYGYQKIMLQYGMGSIKRSGVYDEVMASLEENGIQVIECGGVEPNPKVSFVRKAVGIAREENVELILAVGGGSVIDSCKSTALCAKSEADPWEIQTGRAAVKEVLPVACILTHAAAGSEMSRSAVITNEETNTKRGCAHGIQCTFSILNPELTYSVPPYQTACGVVDMLSHTMERYFTGAGPALLTDSVAEGIMRTILHQGKAAMENPQSYEARADLMWASSLSHNGLTGCGRPGVFAVHPIEHALSGLYDNVSHGAGLAVLYPAWAKYVCKYAPDRFARFARNVWGVADDDDRSASREGIERMESYFREIGMPCRLSDFGIGRDAAGTIADHCTENDTVKIKSYIPLGKKEVEDILELCC